MMRQSEKGFSMMELLFAMLILTVVIMGMVGVLASLIQRQAEGLNYEKVSIAGDLIFGQAGQALSENFDRPLIPDLFEEGQQPIAELEGFSVEVTETQERDDLKRVDIAIFWTDENGVSRRKSMSTKFLKGR